MVGDIGTPASFWVAVSAALLLGLRHGADPDHLAAIDNLTRRSLNAHDRLSRFVGTMFAGGHSIIVLVIAALIGGVGDRFVRGTSVEAAGTWISIATLYAMALVNLRQLSLRRTTAAGGLKYTLLPRSLRAATSSFAAIPIGLLFGLGFDTSSQLATYTFALTSGHGSLVLGALIGLSFALGMGITDTLDSMLVHRLCTRYPVELVQVRRLWLGAVTALALLVASYELAQALGWRANVPDLALSGILMSALFLVFFWTLYSRSVAAADDVT